LPKIAGIEKVALKQFFNFDFLGNFGISGNFAIALLPG
jgi:hypothetical protein